MQSEPAGRNPPIEAAWMCDQQELLIIAGGTTPVLVFIDPWCFCSSSKRHEFSSLSNFGMLNHSRSWNQVSQCEVSELGLWPFTIDCRSRWSLIYKTDEEAVYSTWEPFCFPNGARDARNPGWTWSMVQCLPKHICNLYSGLKKGQAQCNIDLSFNSLNSGFKQDNPSIYST